MADRPTCAECGSFNLALEAFVYWDSSKGEAQINDLCDKGHYCGTCETQVRLEWIETGHIEVTIPERNTIVAALRYWQEHASDAITAIQKLFPEGAHSVIGDEAIDYLLERILDE